MTSVLRPTSAAAILAALALTIPTARAQSIPAEQSAFTDYMAQRLQREVGGAPVVVSGPLALSVDALQVSVERVFRYCEKNPSTCPQASEQYIKGVAQLVKAQNAPIAPAAVRLVVRSSAYIQRAQATLGADGPVLQWRPLVDGLVAVAVLDTPSAVRPLDERDLKKLGISQEQLFAMGGQNIRATLRPLGEAAKPVGAAQIGTVGGSFYEVGRVALPVDWAPLAAAQNGTLLIALPTTDTVLYISESTPLALDALRTFAKTVAEKSPNPLSPAVLKWTKDRWELQQ